VKTVYGVAGPRNDSLVDLPRVRSVAFLNTLLEGVYELPTLAPPVISKEAPHRTIGSHEKLRAD
jgi:hypothetical protein